MNQFISRSLAVAAAFCMLSCGDTQTTTTTPQKAGDGVGAPGLSAIIALPVIREGQRAAIVVTLTRGLPASMDIVWEVVVGAQRFVTSSGSTVFPAGSVAATIQIPTVDNSLFDGDTRAQIRVRDAAGVFAPVEIFVGIVENDPAPFVSIADQEGVRGSRIDLAIELSTPSNLETVIGWKSIDATAQAGVDYIATSGTARIPAGELRAIIGVTTLPLARDSNFTVKLISSENASLADSSATAHILPGNNLNTKVSFMNPSSTLIESSTGGSVGLQLSNPIGIDVTVELSVEGDASVGSDYVAFPLTVTIPAGSVDVILPIQIVDDQIFEREEVLRLRLKSSTNASFGIQTSHTIYIQDNDIAPTISVSDAQAAEGRALSFSVSLSQVSGADTTFSYLTVNGTAGMADFTAVAGTVTILKGQTVARVAVPTTQDGLHEDTEEMTLSLSETTGATLLRASARGLILDDDTAPSVEFAAANQTVGATQTTVNVVINLSSWSGAAVSVPFHVNGSAVEGSDHNLAAGVITVPAGQTSATISFSVFRHGSRNVIIMLDSATGATMGSQVEHTVTF